LVGWTGALRRSELMVLTTEDAQLVEGEGVILLRSPLEERSGR